MQPLQCEHLPDGFRAPALVCAFKGGNDVGAAASSATQLVGAARGAARPAPHAPGDAHAFQPTQTPPKRAAAPARSPGRRGRARATARRPPRSWHASRQRPGALPGAWAGPQLLSDDMPSGGDTELRRLERDGRLDSLLAA